MGKICEQFEAESPTDSEATQKARFEFVLDLMQQVRSPLPSAHGCCLGVGGGGVWEERHAARRRLSTREVPKPGPQKMGQIPRLRFLFGLLCCFLGSSVSQVPLIFQLQDLGHPPKELAGEMVSISSPRFESESQVSGIL